MATFSIDALARAAGTTVRNVRAYREKGLLPRPKRQGRRAIYSEDHLARLRLITQLLDRGLPSALIRDLVRTWESGEDVAELLGLEDALLGQTGGSSIPERVTVADLTEIFAADPDLAQIPRAVELGALEPTGDGDFLVRNPRLLRLASELTSEGMQLRVILDLGFEMKSRIGALIEVFIDTLWTELFAEQAREVSDDEGARALLAKVRRIRPMGRIAVDAELRDAIQAGLDRRMPQILAELGWLDDTEAG